MEFYLLKTLNRRDWRFSVRHLKRHFKVKDRKNWPIALNSVILHDELLGLSNKVPGSSTVMLSEYCKIVEVDMETKYVGLVGEGANLNNVIVIIRYKDLTVFMDYQDAKGTKVYKGKIAGDANLLLPGIALVYRGFNWSGYDNCAQMSKNQLYYIQAKQRTLVRIDLDELSDAISTGKEYTPQQIDAEVRIFAAVDGQPAKAFHLTERYHLKHHGLVLTTVFEDQKNSRPVNCMAATTKYIILPTFESETLTTDFHLMDHSGRLLHKLALEKMEYSEPRELKALETKRFTVLISMWWNKAFDVLAVDNKQLHLLARGVESCRGQPKENTFNMAMRPYHVKNGVIELTILRNEKPLESLIIRL